MMVTLLLLIFQIIIESLPVSSSGHINLLRLVLEKFGYSAPILMDVAFRNLSNAPTLIVFAFYFFKQGIMMVHMLKRNIKVLCKFIFFLASGTLATLLTYGGMIFIGRVIFTTSCKLAIDRGYTIFSGIGFLITGALLFSLKYVSQDKYVSLTYKKILLIGFFQGIALLPGISRLGITYVVGRWLKLRPYKSFIVSCALQVPLLIAGFLQTMVLTLFMNAEPIYKTIYGSLLKHPFFVLIFIMALCVAYVLLGCVEYLIRKERLWKISFYMLIPFIVACLL